MNNNGEDRDIRFQFSKLNDFDRNVFSSKYSAFEFGESLMYSKSFNVIMRHFFFFFIESICVSSKIKKLGIGYSFVRYSQTFFY